MLLHKPNNYADGEEKPAWEKEELYCYIDKNRHGTTGTVKFNFYGSTGKLVPIRERMG
jgi:replicative DNA helicase